MPRARLPPAGGAPCGSWHAAPPGNRGGSAGLVEGSPDRSSAKELHVRDVLGSYEVYIYIHAYICMYIRSTNVYMYMQIDMV